MIADMVISYSDILHLLSVLAEDEGLQVTFYGKRNTKIRSKEYRKNIGHFDKSVGKFKIQSIFPPFYKVITNLRQQVG